MFCVLEHQIVIDRRRVVVAVIVW